jgi:Concanavalin A-like lectin/glucanases superfamily/FG-GAP-like repeat
MPSAWCLQLGQQGDYAVLGTINVTSAAATFEAWIQTAVCDTTQILFQVSQAGTPCISLTDQRLRVSWQGERAESPDSTWVADNNWHHIAVVFNQGALTFYKDGIAAAEVLRLPVRSVSNVALQLGAIGSADGAGFCGLIGDIRVWTQALSAKEISGGMYLTLQGNEPGLTAYCTCADGSFRDLVSGTLGTLYGAAEVVTPATAMPAAPVLPLTFNGAAWSDAGGWAAPACYETIQVARVSSDSGIGSSAVLLGRGPNGIEVRQFEPLLGDWLPLPNGPSFADLFDWNLPQYYSTIQCADIDGDGQAELLVRAADGMQAYRYDHKTKMWSLITSGGPCADAAGWDQPQYYTTIQFADIDGDGQAEMLARSGAGLLAFHYDRDAKGWNALPPTGLFADAAGWNQPQYYTTIQCADIDGDGQAELLARSGTGLLAYRYNRRTQEWAALPGGGMFPDAAGWDQPQYYATIQYADIDGDGQAELLARSGAGLLVFRYEPTTLAWSMMTSGGLLADADNWNLPRYYTTIQCADIDGDGQAELLARSATGMLAFHYDRTANGWNELPPTGLFADAAGWNQPPYYATIKCADIDGDGRAELLARAAVGVIGFSYMPACRQWSPTLGTPHMPPFPRFDTASPGRIAAYAFICGSFNPPITDLRTYYTNNNADLLDTYLTQLGSLQPPEGMPAGDWHIVKIQLVTELNYIQDVCGYFNNIASLITNDTLAYSLALQAIATRLGLTDQSEQQTEAAVFGLIGNIIWSLSGVAALFPVAGAVAAGIGVVGGLVGSSLSFGLSQSLGSSFQGNYATLQSSLENAFVQAVNSNTQGANSVVQNWGLLSLMGERATTTFLFPPEPPAPAPSMLDLILQGYKIWCFQSLAPAVWQVFTYRSSVPEPLWPGYPVKWMAFEYDAGGDTGHWLCITLLKTGVGDGQPDLDAVGMLFNLTTDPQTPGSPCRSRPACTTRTAGTGREARTSHGEYKSRAITLAQRSGICGLATPFGSTRHWARPVHEIEPRDHQQRRCSERRRQHVMHDEIAGDHAKQRGDEGKCR